MSRVHVTVEDHSAKIALLAKATGRTAGKRGADALAAGIKARTPHDQGDLAASWHVEPASAAEAEQGGQRPDWIVTNKRDTFYGLFVEFGTVHSHAQPHVRPSLEVSRGSFEALVRGLFRAALG